MFEAEERPLLDESISWEDAQQRLRDAGIGDGLPLVPPTERRLERMLAGIDAPRRSYGHLPPLFGEITPARVAYDCVLAGCEPPELPVVLSALTACLEAEFNLLGIQTTTGTPAVAVVVHGPVAQALGMNSGGNCLGPGNRANACIGRAVQLALVNIGGARPGVGDMATMGQPGKYSFCFAESGDSGLSPLHVRRGFRADQSAVTVLGVSGTAEILPASERESPEAILRPVLAAMASARVMGGPAVQRPPGEQFFLLPPELAQLLRGHGWDLDRIRNYLFREQCEIGFSDAADRFAGPIADGPEQIHPVVSGGPGIKMTYLPLWMGGTRSVTTPLVPL